MLLNNMETPIDLDKARDEKMIPVAQGVLSDMADLMIPEDANVKVDYNPVLLKILGRTLEADTNVETENPYIFQLLLGVFASINKVAQDTIVSAVDDVRYGRIQKQILQIVAKAHVRMGSVTEEEKDADFSPIKQELNGLFAEEKLSIIELKYVMDNILQSFKDVQSIFATNVEQSTSKAIAKSMDLEFVSDLTMKKLDSILKGE